MAFKHEYPYTNFHELNADYLLKRLSEIEESIKTIKETIEAEVMEYVIETLAPYEAELNALVDQVNALQTNVESTLRAYDNRINVFENLVNAQIEDIKQTLKDSIDAVNLLTDTKIEQNNIYLMGEITRNVGDLFVVLNPFTGETVTIQSMIDYLSAFHIQDGISYNLMNQRALTYTQFNNLNVSYTDLLLHGNTIYV